MIRRFVLAVSVFMMTAAMASGQSSQPPASSGENVQSPSLQPPAPGQSMQPPISPPPPVIFPGINPGHVDRPAVPIDQVADAIVILVPNENFDLLSPATHERVVTGTITRLLKGPVPPLIVHKPHGFVTSLKAGVPKKIFLKKFADRDGYYIIGVFAVPQEDKP
jgi:hypothetical protein